MTEPQLALITTEPKLALITGANKGIGFETARQLGQQGVRVLIGARDAAKGEAAADTLRAEGFDVMALTIDVTDETSIRTAAAQVEKEFGKLDILVNNAGIGLFHRLPSEVGMAELKEVLDTNLFGAILTAQAFLPLLRQSDSGCIVNVSSTLGSLFCLSDPHWIGHQGLFTPYSMSKVALNAFTALLSAELINTPIRVNSVEPGYTATDMTQHQGFQTVEQAAQVIVKYATIGPDGPTGSYFDGDGRMSW